MPDVQDLRDQLQRVIQSRVADIYTALPGIVERYDAAKMQADVRVAVNRPLPTEEDPDAVVYEEHPVLPSVPVAFPRGGGCSVTFPLNVGDSVLLVFSSLSPQGWRQTGNVADAGDTRAHSLGSAFAIPCIAPDNQLLAHSSANALVADGPAVHVGAGAVDPIARAPAIISDLNKIIADLASIVAGVNGAFPGTIPDPLTFVTPDPEIAAEKGFVK